jgi:hypothetical protein
MIQQQGVSRRGVQRRCDCVQWQYNSSVYLLTAP